MFAFLILESNLVEYVRNDSNSIVPIDLVNTEVIRWEYLCAYSSLLI